MRAFGLEAAAAALPPPEPCKVYRHNWLTFSVWAAVWRQWRWVPLGMGGAQRDGLDWVQVEAVMRIKRIPSREREEVFAGLQVMEAATLAALSEKDG